MAPVAARILGTLILTGKQGITFENLVCELGASKSTISTHLTTLQATNRITYYTKSGDRKKYSSFIPKLLIKSMEDMWELGKRGRDLHLEILESNQKDRKTTRRNSSHVPCSNPGLCC